MNKIIGIIIAITAILGMFLAFQTCKTRKYMPEKIVQKIDTFYSFKRDTVFQEHLTYKTIKTTLHDSINVYKDTVWSNGSRVIISDTLRDDTIVNRNIDFNIKQTLITDSIFIPVKDNKLRIFAGPSFNLNTKTIGAGLNLTYKKITINAGWNNSFIVGVGIKIK